MRILKILDSDFGRELRPKFACDVDYEQAGYDLANLALSTSVNVAGAARQQKYNRELMALSHEYNKDLQLQSANLEQRNWQSQFDASNSYNTPSNQVSRLLAAGVNPFVDSSTAAPVAGTNSSPSPSSVGVAGVSPLPAPNVNYTSALRDLVSAAKDSRELPFVSDKIQAEIDRIINESKDSAARASLTQIKADIEGEFGARTAERTLKLLSSRIREVQSIVDKNDMEGFLAWKQGLLADANRALTAKEYEWLEPKVKKYLDLLESQIKSNYASAEESHANAGLIDERKTGQILANGLDAKLYDGKSEMFDNELRKIKLENEQLAYSIEIAAANAQVAKVRGDNAVVVFWRDFIMDTVERGVGIYGSVASAKASLGNMKSYRDLSETQQKRVDAEIEDMVQNRAIRTAEDKVKFNHKHVEHTQRTPNGTITKSYYE